MYPIIMSFAVMGQPTDLDAQAALALAYSLPVRKVTITTTPARKLPLGPTVVVPVTPVVPGAVGAPMQAPGIQYYAPGPCPGGMCPVAGPIVPATQTITIRRR